MKNYLKFIYSFKNCFKIVFQYFLQVTTLRRHRGHLKYKIRANLEP